MIDFPERDVLLRYWLGIPLWGLGAAVLVAAFVGLRSTTLRATVTWCWACWGLLLATLIYPAQDYPSLPYTAAVFAVAPILAALGAKRPQNGAWQFIVVTLVAVLLLPVLQSWAFGNGTPHVHALFRWLIAAHIFLGVGNYLPTRFRGPAFLFGAAEVLLAGGYLPLGLPVVDHREVWAIVCFTTALLWSLRTSRSSPSHARGLNTLWRDFRDTYGAAWALRVAERLNATAKQQAWPVEFTWGGIVLSGSSTASADDDAALDALDSAVRHRIERELRSLLRRFVSHDWIAARLSMPASEIRWNRR